jgi:uncharacterized protein YnzC (UPF0291/DUF896 family)
MTTVTIDSRLRHSLTLLKYTEMSEVRMLPKAYLKYIRATLKDALKEVNS